MDEEDAAAVLSAWFRPPGVSQMKPKPFDSLEDAMRELARRREAEAREG